CRRFIIVLALATLIASQAVAQQADPSALTLDRIFSSKEFTPDSLGPVRWMDGGASYTRLEPSATVKDARDIVRYDTESGRREVLVPAERFISIGSSSPLAVDNYTFSPNGKLLLIYTNSQRVWRQNTRGDYWVLDIGAGKLAKLGGDAKPATSMF